MEMHFDGFRVRPRSMQALEIYLRVLVCFSAEGDMIVRSSANPLTLWGLETQVGVCYLAHLVVETTCLSLMLDAM